MRAKAQAQPDFLTVVNHNAVVAQKVLDSKDDDPGNPTLNFHGEKRCNDTHQSTT